MNDSEREAFETLKAAEPYRDRLLGVGLDTSEVGHPPSKFARMLDLGLVATVNSDDPAYFGGYLNENFRQVAAAVGLSREEIEDAGAQPP